MFLILRRSLPHARAIGYKLGMGNARYFQETLFVKLEHFAKLTFSTPEKVKARLLTFDEAKGAWSGDLAGGEDAGQYWVSADHLWKRRKHVCERQVSIARIGT